MSIFSERRTALPRVRDAGRVRARPQRQRRPPSRPARRHPRGQLPAPDLPALQDAVSRRPRVHLHGHRPRPVHRRLAGEPARRMAQLRRQDAAVFEQTLGSSATAEAQSLGDKLTRGSCSAGRRSARRSSPARPASTTAPSRWPRWPCCARATTCRYPGGRSSASSASSTATRCSRWVRADSEQRQDAVRMPRALIGEIEAERDAVAEGCSTTWPRAWSSTSSARCWPWPEARFADLCWKPSSVLCVRRRSSRAGWLQSAQAAAHVRWHRCHHVGDELLLHLESVRRVPVDRRHPEQKPVRNLPSPEQIVAAPSACRNRCGRRDLPWSAST